MTQAESLLSLLSDLNAQVRALQVALGDRDEQVAHLRDEVRQLNEAREAAQ